MKKKTSTVYVGLGSNIGNKVENCQKAIEKVQQNNKITIIKVSSLYKTEPIGYNNQDWFINCVLELHTLLIPDELLSIFKQIEKDLKRVNNIKWGPRTIDLDLLLYNNLIINKSNLQIPHPQMHRRSFVLTPLSEIAPDIIHPIFSKTAMELLQNLKDEQKVEKYKGS